jgi:hypothetical protein
MIRVHARTKAKERPLDLISWRQLAGQQTSNGATYRFQFLFPVLQSLEETFLVENIRFADRLSGGQLDSGFRTPQYKN